MASSTLNGTVSYLSSMADQILVADQYNVLNLAKASYLFYSHSNF